jgi:glycosyltransferase involved in cell wall biosynthesis
MSKKSIAIFTNTLLSVLLAQNMKEKYHVLLIIYYGNKVEAKYNHLFTDTELEVVSLQGNHLKKMWMLYCLLKKNKVSVIFSYLLTTNLIGAIVGKLAGVTVRAGGIRNAVLDKKKVPVQRLINNHLSTHTIYNNYNGLVSLQEKGFKPQKATVIPNCFELKTEPFIRKSAPLANIITVGRFVHQKGYFDALKIMKALKDEGLKFKYFIVGFGELEGEIRTAVNEMQLNDVVEVVINPPNIDDYYRRADVYLCTSYFEGLSNTVMEALSFSLPVVATAVGDNDRLVTNGLNGFLIEGFNYLSFIEPLKKLLSSAELRNSMGAESYKIIKDNYSTAAFTANYEEFISRTVIS